ncbi:MAG: ABC transporter permease [Actinomycetia bacterium]|nr:ABC transporter permease [Actinomycetes bacterium]
MTAIEVTEAPPRTAIQATRTRDVLRGEWIKMRSVRSTVWTLVALFGFGAGLTVLICATTADGIASGETGESAGSFITWGMLIAQVTAIVLGVLAVSSEYSTGMIRTTLAATPRRGQMMFAKCALLAAVLFVAGTVTAFVGYFAANPFLEAEGVGVPLDSDGVVRAMFGCGLYLAGLGLFAAAFAFLVRHTAAALSLALAFIFVVGNLVMLIPGEVGEWITKLMPGNAGGSIAFVVNFDPNAFDPWTGFGVFCLEIAVLLGLAAARFVRRDA